MKKNSVALLIGCSLVALDAWLWFVILGRNGIASQSVPREYFFDVGSGESELLIFPGNVKMLIDAGPDGATLLADMQKVLPADDSYIDLAVISEPTLPYFGGYQSLLDHYQVGTFLYDGRSAGESVWQWPELLAKIKEKDIPMITVGAGDEIQYGDSKIDVLSPETAFARSPSLEDAALVELVTTPVFRTLFTAGIGVNVENYLQQETPADLKTDVIKVPQDAAKDISSKAFFDAAGAAMAVAEAGAHAGLASSTDAQIFNAQKGGTIEISASTNEALRVEQGSR